MPASMTTVQQNVNNIQIIPFFLNLADIAAAGDFLTNYTPGFPFRVLGLDFQVIKPVTTASKRADFNVEINTTDVTGGVVSVTSAAATPQGTVIAGTAVTGNNVGGITDTISIKSSTVTAHAEGNGCLLLKLEQIGTVETT